MVGQWFVIVSKLCPSPCKLTISRHCDIGTDSSISKLHRFCPTIGYFSGKSAFTTYMHTVNTRLAPPWLADARPYHGKHEHAEIGRGQIISANVWSKDCVARLGVRRGKMIGTWPQQHFSNDQRYSRGLPSNFSTGFELLIRLIPYLPP